MAIDRQAKVLILWNDKFMCLKEKTSDNAIERTIVGFCAFLIKDMVYS